MRKLAELVDDATPKAGTPVLETNAPSEALSDDAEAPVPVYDHPFCETVSRWLGKMLPEHAEIKADGNTVTVSMDGNTLDLDVPALAAKQTEMGDTETRYFIRQALIAAGMLSC